MLGSVLILALGIGLAVGSFLTVVTSRLATGEQIVWGRSHCPHCKRSLNVFELVPVLSYLVQGGRCRACNVSIPKSYLVIELTSAVLFGWITYGVFHDSIPLPQFLAGSGVETAIAGLVSLLLANSYYFIFTALAIAISVFDYRHKLIPRLLSTPLILLGCMNIVVSAIRFSDPALLTTSLVVSGSSFLLFWVLWFASGGRAMGRGDADIALGITLVLGPYLGIGALLAAFWSGALFGILKVVSGDLHMKSEIPFAPFLLGGAIAALLVGKSILAFISIYI